MYWSNKMPTKKVRGVRPVEITCSNCNNASAHELFWWVPGAFMKFAGVVVVGKKHYGYVCPICEQVNKEVTQDQASLLARAGW